MPKLQFMTIYLIRPDNSIIPEIRRGKIQSSSSISMICDIPQDRAFSLRLSSSPLPFDTVVKVWQDGKFLTGRCFVARNAEPIIEHEICGMEDPERSIEKYFHFKSSFTTSECFFEFRKSLVTFYCPTCVTG